MNIITGQEQVDTATNDMDIWIENWHKFSQ